MNFALFYHSDGALSSLKGGISPGSNLAKAVNAAVVCEIEGQPFTRMSLMDLVLPALLPPGPAELAAVPEDVDAEEDCKAPDDMTPAELREHTRQLVAARKIHPRRPEVAL